jgi:hypothetical protein
VLFNTAALPSADREANLSYADDTVTLLHVSSDGAITQARLFTEKQALLQASGVGALLTIWTRQGIATVYSVNRREELRQAMGVHSRTAGRSYHSAPEELEAARFEGRPYCSAATGDVCRTQAGGVAAYYHRGRDGSTSGTAKVPKSRMPSA